MIRQVTARTLQRSLRPNKAIQIATRTLVLKPPGPDPLDVLRKECVHRNLCDTMGYRQPGVHWVFSVAMTGPPDSPPNLRTVGIQRVGPAGIDFVMKKGCKTSHNLGMEQPLSVLYTQGKYVPGQSSEQWRGEGHCEKIDLDEVLHCIPHYTITGMVVSKQIEMEEMQKKNNELQGNVSVVSTVTYFCAKKCSLME